MKKIKKRCGNCGGTGRINQFICLSADKDEYGRNKRITLPCLCPKCRGRGYELEKVAGA